MKDAATSQQIQDMFGEIDALTIERILETRATVDEIAEARAELEDEQRIGQWREPTSACVEEVRKILEDLLLEDDDPDVTS